MAFYLFSPFFTRNCSCFLPGFFSPDFFRPAFCPIPYLLIGQIGFFRLFFLHGIGLIFFAFFSFGFFRPIFFTDDGNISYFLSSRDRDRESDIFFFFYFFRLFYHVNGVRFVFLYRTDSIFFFFFQHFFCIGKVYLFFFFLPVFFYWIDVVFSPGISFFFALIYRTGLVFSFFRLFFYIGQIWYFCPVFLRTKEASLIFLSSKDLSGTHKLIRCHNIFRWRKLYFSTSDTPAIVSPASFVWPLAILTTVDCSLKIKKRKALHFIRCQKETFWSKLITKIYFVV